MKKCTSHEILFHSFLQSLFKILSILVNMWWVPLEIHAEMHVVFCAKCPLMKINLQVVVKLIHISFMKICSAVTSCYMSTDRWADTAKPVGIFLQVFVVYASEAECNFHFYLLVTMRPYWVKCSCTEVDDNRLGTDFPLHCNVFKLMCWADYLRHVLWMFFRLLCT
jgi:hypothetical protein